MSSDKLKILICGGGNGAHCFAGIASSNPNVEVRVLTLYENEAEVWTNALQDGDLKVSIAQKDGSMKTFKSSPTIVTKDPAKAIQGVQIIFIIVPSYCTNCF